VLLSALSLAMGMQQHFVLLLLLLLLLYCAL
jgi:hypothetical protein